MDPRSRESQKLGESDLNRDDMIEYCKRSPDLWDVLIIGGGATGLGTAVDAASRGFRTLVLEQCDFAKGTSSRSTKLIHGGLRYLKQGSIALVIEALKERGMLCKNAPHLVSQLGFFVPFYRRWDSTFYGFGIKLYDFLAGKYRLAKAVSLSRKEALLRFPTIEPRGLQGGIIYYDGQFDDARLAITLAQTAVDLGGVAINYMQVVRILKEKGSVVGVIARDLETGDEYPLRSKCVINATGVFSDAVRQMDDPKAKRMVAPSQGVHLVLDRSFMPGDTALLIPRTDDGRVLFCVPWHRHLLVGTTDTGVEKATLEPKPLETEIAFILKHASRYLTRPCKRDDVLTVFAGLRPLIHEEGISSSSLSRDHAIFISPSGLITITGGKWTTYRKMGEDVIDKAIAIHKLPDIPCRTKNLHLHGYLEKKHALDSWMLYGNNGKELEKLAELNPEWKSLLHPRLPYFPVELVWAVRREMARTLEDLLARRTRSLFLDVKASLEIAPRAAQILAKELGKDLAWEKAQLAQFQELAKGYF